MRKKNQKIRCEKQRLPKFKGLCKTYDKVQTATAVYLSQQEDIVCVRCNVDSAVIDGKEYTTDFVCEMADGTLAIRECLYRRYITKPLNLKVLQNTIDKYKKLAQEQAQVIVQKEMFVNSLRSEVTKLKQLLAEKTREAELQEKRNGRLERDLRDTKKRLKSEEESSRSWYHRYREKEEEFAKEKAKTAWEKFREKHHIFRRRYKLTGYYKPSFWERFGGKILMGMYCIIWIGIGIACLVG